MSAKVDSSTSVDVVWKNKNRTGAAAADEIQRGFKPHQQKYDDHY